MQSLRITFALILTGILLPVLRAQSAEEILTGMTQAFGALEHVQITVQGKLHLRGEVVASTINAEMIRAGNHFYSRFMETEIVMSDSLLLTIDVESKIMIVDRVSPVSVAGAALTGYPMQEALLALEAYASRLKLASDGKKGHILRMENPQAAIAEALVYVDGRTHLPYRFEYKYNPAIPSNYERMVADYTFKTLSETYRSRKFDIDQYLDRRQNPFRGAGAYEGYRIVTRL